MTLKTVAVPTFMKIIEKNGVFYRKWQAEKPRCALLLVHGLGAHGDRWGFCAEYFLTKNISSYAIDLRGFGETPDTRGHIDNFGRYYADICRLREIIASETAQDKVFLAGESMGALIAFILVAERYCLFNGLICVSPAFVSKMKASAPTCVRLIYSMLFNRKNNIAVPFTSDMCTRDKDYREKMDKDPRELRFATAGLLLNIFKGQIKSRALKDKIKASTLFLVAGEDQMVSAKAAIEIFGGLKAEDKTLIEYPDMAHAMSIDIGRDKVFYDIHGWIDTRI